MLRRGCIISRICSDLAADISPKNAINLKRFCSTETPNHYDIVIAGGGMIGTTLGCALGKNKRMSNKKILLLEASDRKEWKLPPTYSNRVSSLTPGTKKLLTRIDAWKHISEARYAQVKKLQVWDALSDAMITFNHDNMEEDIAYIVENDLILNAVSVEGQKCPNFKIRYNSNVAEYSLPAKDGDQTQLKLQNGEKITTGLLLGCDGANSQVRKAMGVHYLSWNYDQTGVVATLSLSEPTENIVAWQRFLPTGPIAILPLTSKLSSLVWSTTPSHAKELLNMSNELFVDAVNDALWKSYKQNDIVTTVSRTFDKILKSVQLPSTSIRQLPPTISNCQDGSRAAFPLGFGHAANYVGRGVALVGDAAHRIHPLAGQGVNLGFGDIICLERILGDAVSSGSKIDNQLYLKDYESERQLNNLPTMLVVDGLQRLYNMEFPPAVALRSLGLQSVHAFTFLKKALISQASH